MHIRRGNKAGILGKKRSCSHVQRSRAKKRRKRNKHDKLGQYVNIVNPVLIRTIAL